MLRVGLQQGLQGLQPVGLDHLGAFQKLCQLVYSQFDIIRCSRNIPGLWATILIAQARTVSECLNDCLCPYFCKLGGLWIQGQKMFCPRNIPISSLSWVDLRDKVHFSNLPKKKNELTMAPNTLTNMLVISCVYLSDYILFFKISNVSKSTDECNNTFG